MNRQSKNDLSLPKNPAMRKILREFFFVTCFSS